MSSGGQRLDPRSKCPLLVVRARGQASGELQGWAHVTNRPRGTANDLPLEAPWLTDAFARDMATPALFHLYGATWASDVRLVCASRDGGCDCRDRSGRAQ